MTREEPHLSYSQINTYMTCPLKYRFSYIDGLVGDFTSSALHFGHAIHSCIQAFLQSWLEADPLRADHLVDIYREEWRRFDGPPVRFSKRESEESLFNTAKQVFTLFTEQHDPAIEIIAVEEPFTLDLTALSTDCPRDMPPLMGYVDAILKNGSTVLVDYKTSSRKPNGDVNAMQLVAYSLAALDLGYDPNELQYRYDYLLKTAKPELVGCPVAIKDNDRKRFLKTTTRVWTAIQSSIFYPNPSYLCGSCAYKRSCNEW
jgi:putative RecB family exonuclease